ncbi:MAG TPA: ester cyclase [Candidatus Angelobacter sp.]|nr:ester cyclase [Candidatus Angelobacter sp.]
MSESINASLLMQYNKLWHVDRVEQAGDVLHQDFTRHGSSGSFKGVASFKAYVRHFLAAFPDAQFLSKDWLWEGDKVAVRYQLVGTHTNDFMGIPPSGKKKRIDGASIYRFADGRIAELWDFLDMLALVGEGLND